MQYFFYFLAQPVFENKDEPDDDIFSNDFDISESNDNAENTNLNLDSAITQHQCSGCKKYFSTKKSLQNHKKFGHCSPKNEIMDDNGDKNDNFKTDEELFEDLVNDMKQNKKSHVPLSPLKLNKFVCTKCNNKWFSNGKALQEHNDDVHGEKSRNFKCVTCGKVYTDSSRLKDHIKSIHEGHKYKCEEEGCKKEFSVRSGLLKHLSGAHGGVTYSCDVCEKSFQIPQSLRYHKSIAHKENKYKCEKCDKVLSGSR